MPQLAEHVRDVPVNQIREITEAAWATPGAIVLSIGEPGFPLARHVIEAGMACLDREGAMDLALRAPAMYRCMPLAGTRSPHGRTKRPEVAWRQGYGRSDCSGHTTPSRNHGDCTLRSSGRSPSVLCEIVGGCCGAIELKPSSTIDHGSRVVSVRASAPMLYGVRLVIIADQTR